MRTTIGQLRKIIKEETSRVIRESEEANKAEELVAKWALKNPEAIKKLSSNPEVAAAVKGGEDKVEDVLLKKVAGKTNEGSSNDLDESDTLEEWGAVGTRVASALGGAVGLPALLTFLVSQGLTNDAARQIITQAGASGLTATALIGALAAYLAANKSLSSQNADIRQKFPALSDLTDEQIDAWRKTGFERMKKAEILALSAK